MAAPFAALESNRIEPLYLIEFWRIHQSIGINLTEMYILAGAAIKRCTQRPPFLPRAEKVTTSSTNCTNHIPKAYHRCPTLTMEW